MDMNINPNNLPPNRPQVRKEPEAQMVYGICTPQEPEDTFSSEAKMVYGICTPQENVEQAAEQPVEQPKESLLDKLKAMFHIGKKD